MSQRALIRLRETVQSLTIVLSLVYLQQNVLFSGWILCLCGFQQVFAIFTVIGVPPHQSSWKKTSSRCSRTGQPSHQTWTLLSMYWLEERGGSMNSKSPVRLLSLLLQMRSSISNVSPHRVVWIQHFCLFKIKWTCICKIYGTLFVDPSRLLS